jgi:hypothetical protein
MLMASTFEMHSLISSCATATATATSTVSMSPPQGASTGGRQNSQEISAVELQRQRLLQIVTEINVSMSLLSTRTTDEDDC